MTTERREGMAQEVTSVRSRRQLTVTVPSDLGGYVEEVSAETGLNKSAVVSRALEADRERRKEQLMREGYEEMAASDRELLREFEHVDRDSAWPEY